MLLTPDQAYVHEVETRETDASMVSKRYTAISLYVILVVFAVKRNKLF